MHIRHLSKEEVRTIELARERTEDRLTDVLAIIQRLDEEVSRLRKPEKLPDAIHLPE